MAIKNMLQYNRIINLYFYSTNEAGVKYVADKIICPTRGRKPEIEIVGTFQPSLQGGGIPEFTITVTNLYLDLANKQYTQIRVEAGYESNLLAFEGSIYSIFQESPGPDGKTVISCYLGTIENWLSSRINLDLDPGARLEDIINKISKALNFTKVPEIPPELKGLTLPARFTEEGLVSDVLNKLLKQFEEKELRLAEDDGTLYLYSVGTPPSALNQIEIKFLMTPPQKNVGNDDGSYYTVFTAPWDPRVKPGTKVIFPAWQFVKFFNLVNKEADTNAIIVQFVRIHFGTVGSINQMQVEGLGVKV